MTTDKGCTDLDDSINYDIIGATMWQWYWNESVCPDEDSSAIRK